MTLADEVAVLMAQLMTQSPNIYVSKDMMKIAEEITHVPEKPKDYELKFWDWSGKDQNEINVVLVTGGLDSTALYYMLADTGSVLPLYFDFGQPYANKEKAALASMGIIPKSMYIGHTWNPSQYWGHIIPGRNLLLIAGAAEEIQITGGTIHIGAVNGEMPISGGDKSFRFFELVSDLLSHRYPKVKIAMPLKDMTKVDLVQWMMSHGYVSQLLKTVSCFSSERGHCGECRACLRKYIAFKANGLALGTHVDIRTGCKDEIKRYLEEMTRALALSDFSKYSKRRCEQDLEVLRTLRYEDASSAK